MKSEGHSEEITEGAEELLKLTTKHLEWAEVESKALKSEAYGK